MFSDEPSRISTRTLVNFILRLLEIGALVYIAYRITYPPLEESPKEPYKSTSVFKRNLPSIQAHVKAYEAQKPIPPAIFS
jgi:hypothetical protein